MTRIYEIKELGKVIKPFLGPNRTIANYEARPLTSGGENYGSLMLAVSIKVKNNASNEDENINVIAKMCPPNELLKMCFNVGVTVKKEISFYAEILKTLKHFLKENGFEESLDFFAEYYGSRISLNPNSDTVDDDAVLLLENLKLSGFDMVNRFEGFDYETTKIILKHLAIFHAVPLAYKLLKRKDFEENFMIHLGPSQDLEMIFPAPDIETKIINQIVKSAVEGDPKCEKLSPKLMEILKKQMKLFKNPPPVKDPFGTITHSDFWVNNIMVKFVDKQPISIKFVDFQMYFYESLARDLIFFLLTSVQLPIIKKYLDEFIRFYQECFVKVLQNFNCQVGEYTLDKLQVEIIDVLKTSEMLHILIMHKPIFAVKGLIKDVSEFDIEHFLDYEGSDSGKKRIAEIVLLIDDRGWL